MNASARSIPSHHDTSRIVQNMIDGQLATNTITGRPLLRAIADTPRERFVPDNLRGAAYVDSNLDVGGRRYLLAPLTFARMLELAQITPACRVLDIGCLAGYSTAILSRLAAHIVAIDTDAALIETARRNLKENLPDAENINLQQVASLADGYGASAPYDVIVINGAINFVPEVIGLQLSERGRIVTVFRNDDRQGLVNGTGKGLLITRLDGSLQYREHFDAPAAVLDGFKRDRGFTL